MKIKILFYLLILLSINASSIFAQTEIEPNDNFNQAQTITTGMIQASINPDYDTEAGVLIVDVTNVGSNIPLYIGLYDQNQNLLSSQTGNTGANISFEKLVSFRGVYYFKFQSNNSNSPYRSNSQLHNITFGLDTSDVYEWNNNFNTVASFHIKEQYKHKSEVLAI